jgi:hypothetical protein
MPTALTISLLFGAVLGFRFKVFILVPAILVGFVTSAGAGVAVGDSFYSVAINMGLAAIGLQFGYVAGSVISGIRGMLGTVPAQAVHPASAGGRLTTPMRPR